MKIKKAEYDALPDNVKPLFVADGEDFISQTEADKALKDANAGLLEDLKKKGDALKLFEGLDAEAAKKALEEVKKAENKKLSDKGEYEKLLEQYQKDFEAKLKVETDKNAEIIKNLKSEKLTNYLVTKGILPDRAKFALSEIGETVELVSNADGFSLKKIGGIGDAKEMDAIVEGLKTNSAFLFAPTGASGSGASGSNGGGSNSGEGLYGQSRMESAYGSNTIT